MKNKIIWHLLKMLFNRTDFKKLLSKNTNETIRKWLNTAIEEEQYELAAFLKYYLEFSAKKQPSDNIKEQIK